MRLFGCSGQTWERSRVGPAAWQAGHTAQTPADLPALEKTRTTAAPHLSGPTQLAIEQQIAFLRSDFEWSLEAALEWAAANPFDTAAHTTAALAREANAAAP